MRESVATFLDAGLLVLAVLAFVLPALSALALLVRARPHRFPRLNTPGWRCAGVAVLWLPFIVMTVYGGVAWWAASVYDRYYFFGLLICFAYLLFALLLSGAGLFWIRTTRRLPSA
ncbi:hypothetical protein [Achromobacter spanius]|uniref:Uncharacterized protein n=1 Tax=Achromobacter spanius TaxID=217203 RepID=A0A2S0ICG5_9BURK|nr:hypothetical protein [Achromobacter spanius]AVJ29674.1 hypothetical protein CLM73_22665 [Achromobacter spanius]